MKKIVIAGFAATLAAVFLAVYHHTHEFSGAAAANLAPCTQNSDCDSGHCSNDAGAAQGICCPSGTCGWGDGSISSRECVSAGQIRENDQMSLVCRNGDWKTRLNGWGCNNSGLACDQGTCQQIEATGVNRCVECSIDPGVSQGCANGEACPSGTVCSNTVCCPAGTCGWGEGQWFTRHCAKNGDYRENRWARLVCRNGVWKTELNGWGCNAFTCDQGTCQDNLYCAYSLPLNPSSQMHETGAYCAGTCKSCSAQGKNCGIVSDQCGGYIYCGACASGQTCNASGQCVSSCVPATCLSLGKLCGVWNDNCGGTVSCGSCPADESCTASGQCAAGDSNSNDCTPNFSKKCDSGHLYWYDSCGNRGGLAQNCGANSATQNFQCRVNWVQQEVIARNCTNGACTESKTWSDSVNCALSGKICAAGVCVANDITPPSLFGLSPSGTIYSANVALTVSTNEASECRYGLQDISFTSMALKFGSSNKTYHSASVVLPAPGSYNYFVRCADTAGNAVATSAKISFAYVLPAQSSGSSGSSGSSSSAGISSPLVLPPVSDKTPPVISDALPAGDVFDEKVQISVTTDEKSSCKYDIAATDYDSMENTLESDGTGTFHSKEVSISAAGNYAYYVNCKDDAGNEAEKTAMVKFNYAQSQPGPAISEIVPEGAVYQEEIMLTAVTDVPAVCRYSPQDLAFEEMTDLLSASDDGLRQSAMITLNDYGNYNYHIRCRDEKGNTQGSYAAVSFEYKDPNGGGEAPVSLECYQIVDGDQDGECDHTLDCVCDPDCPVDGEDEDADCAGVAASETGGNSRIFFLLGFLLILIIIAVIIIIVARRKKTEENLDEEEVLG